MSTWKRTVCCAAALFTAVCSIPKAFTATAEAEDKRIIVALGDSYSSGEGIEPFFGQEQETALKVQDEDWLAHRSALCWSGQLTLPGVSGTMAEHRGENWFFVAASGAETVHMDNSFVKSYTLADAQGSKALAPQLSVFDGIAPGTVDYVTLTLGGNDAGFSSIITCAAGFGDTDLTTKLEQVWAHYYETGGIRDNLKQSYYAIAEAAGPQAAIIVAGYPPLLSPEGNPWIKAANCVAVNEATAKFNDEIESLVSECSGEGLNICFAPVAEEFSGHEAYASEPYLNGIVLFAQAQELDRNAFVSSYSVHPNAEGAKAYARVVQRVIDRLEAANTAAPKLYLSMSTADQPTCAGESVAVAVQVSTDAQQPVNVSLRFNGSDVDTAALLVAPGETASYIFTYQITDSDAAAGFARVGVSAAITGSDQPPEMAGLDIPVIVPRRTVTYLDATGNLQAVEAVVLSGKEMSLAPGWYAAESTTEFAHALTLSSDVSLILTDGCALTLQSLTGTGALCVYGQEAGSGTLMLRGSASVGSYYQYGGSVAMETEAEYALTAKTAIGLEGGSFAADSGISAERIYLGYQKDTDSIRAGKYTANSLSAEEAHAFVTLERELSADTLICSSVPEFAYNGSAQAPEKSDLTGLLSYRIPVFEGTVDAEAVGGKTLVPYPIAAEASIPSEVYSIRALTDADFTLGVVEPGTDAGEYSAEIVGAGLYSGSAKLHWTIIPADVSDAVTVTANSPLYTGFAITAESLSFTAQTPAAQLLLDKLADGEASAEVTLMADGKPVSSVSQAGEYLCNVAITDTADGNFAPFTAQITVTVTDLAQIADDETLCRWAENDYRQKTGTKVSASITGRANGQITLTLTDADGNEVGSYVIDAATGIGTDSAGEAVDLPQTGVTSADSLLLFVCGWLLTALGAACVIGSGLLRRRTNTTESDHGEA